MTPDPDDADSAISPELVEPSPAATRRAVVVKLPDPSLVVLVGVSGAGKSSFGAQHFRPTEVVSSDACRGLVCDDPNEQGVNEQAFGVLHEIVRRRLELGRLTVVDATNVQAEARAPLIDLARAADLFPVAIVLDVPLRTCEDRNAARPDHAHFGPHVARNQHLALRRGIRNLRREGFKQVWTLKPHEIAATTVRRVALWTDRRTEAGPFDIIGDVHGCFGELRTLIDRLGYVADVADDPHSVVRHPEGRRLIFVGDLCDRGPNSVGVIRFVRRLVAEGVASGVAGNHDEKLLRWLRGKDVRVNHGLERTVAEIDALAPDDRRAFEGEARAFLDSLVSHYVLDGGRLVVAHAGMKREYQGRSSARVRSFGLYGETTGETDDVGLPVRRRWAEDYRGSALVVYGHTPVVTPDRLNNTINIDTGCCFGGGLSAYRYPEGEVVTVPALATYAEPARPLIDPATLTAEGSEPTAPGDAVRSSGVAGLRIEDVAGKRLVATALMGNLTIRAEQATPALELLSRFAADPRWLVYLPPTMAPVAAAPSGPFLEHPDAAFSYFQSEGVRSVVCQTKHMGSRAVVVVVRSPEVAVARFGMDEPSLGVILTRTGRRFFNETATETALLGRVAGAWERSGLWDALEADWAVLDAELMPWNAKAEGLIREQYAPVGDSGRLDLAGTLAALRGAQSRGVPVGDLLARAEARASEVDGYNAAFAPYCWPTLGLEGLKLAPFHLLAAGDRAFFDRDHRWHLEQLDRLAAADPELIVPTPRRFVDLDDPAAVADATQWWLDATDRGAEGMVVKPLDFVARGSKGLIQPAVKVRGRSYLRIIYGPEYLLPGNLDRLRARSLGRKRALALREFALGAEALTRFAHREPLYRVHECVAAVLALESEPVDPRL